MLRQAEDEQLVTVRAAVGLDTFENRDATAGAHARGVHRGLFPRNEVAVEPDEVGRLVGGPAGGHACLLQSRGGPGHCIVAHSPTLPHQETACEPTPSSTACAQVEPPSAPWSTSSPRRASPGFWLPPGPTTPCSTWSTPVSASTRFAPWSPIPVARISSPSCGCPR